MERRLCLGRVNWSSEANISCLACVFWQQIDRYQIPDQQQQQQQLPRDHVLEAVTQQSVVIWSVTNNQQQSFVKHSLSR